MRRFHPVSSIMDCAPCNPGQTAPVDSYSQKSRKIECFQGERSMIVGAHSIIYSMNPEADRAFLRDVLKLPHVDVGHGWLIFGLPPSEVAVHPSDRNDVHEFYLMCQDVEALVLELGQQGVDCSPVQNQGWGML